MCGIDIEKNGRGRNMQKEIYRHEYKYPINRLQMTLEEAKLSAVAKISTVNVEPAVTRVEENSASTLTLSITDSVQNSPQSGQLYLATPSTTSMRTES